MFSEVSTTAVAPELMYYLFLHPSGSLQISKISWAQE